MTLETSNSSMDDNYKSYKKNYIDVEITESSPETLKQIEEDVDEMNLVTDGAVNGNDEIIDEIFRKIDENILITKEVYSERVNKIRKDVESKYK